jgi:UDP-N-acetylglucosamine 2-epimerase
MTPEDFLRLVNHATCVVGNSSVGIRECSFLGIPAVNIGPRQEGRARGSNVIDVGYDQTEVAEAITKQMAQGRFQSESTYGDGQAGRRIAELLATSPLEIET